jgi:ribose/xylose/arabinose/galactoside ABC-type transport system permease subunit
MNPSLPSKKLIPKIEPVWFAVILLYIVFGLISPAMFKTNQIFNILQVAAFLGTITIGQTIVILTGGIDLSVSGVVTLVNIVLASVMNGQPDRIIPAVVVCVVLAVVIGLINGTLVAVARITPLIVTLAMDSILFGAALVYTGGAPHGHVTEGFALIGQGSIFGFPLSAASWFAIAAAMVLVTQKLKYGRRLYAVGANPAAANLMGIRVNHVIIGAYILSSLMACFCAILLTAYINLPSLGIGRQYQFASVAAAVVGGASLTGGVGSIMGSIGGALFITELNSFTNIIRVNPGVQYFLQGLIIAASVVLYRAINAFRVKKMQRSG